MQRPHIPRVCHLWFTLLLIALAAPRASSQVNTLREVSEVGLLFSAIGLESVADVNGDGLEDLIVSQQGATGLVPVALSPTDLGPLWTSPEPFLITKALPVRDMDGDSVADLAVRSITLNPLGASLAFLSGVSGAAIPGMGGPGDAAPSEWLGTGSSGRFLASLTNGQLTLWDVLSQTSLVVDPTSLPGFPPITPQSATASCAPGDLDGDQLPDLVLGFTENGFEGHVVALTIPASTAGSPSVLWTSTAIAQVNDGFGQSLAPLGDLNGDGVSDVAVGSDSGRALVLDGASGLPINAVAGGASAILPPAGFTGSNFGRAVFEIGDVTTDGIPDLAVACTGWTSPGVPEMLIYSGADFDGSFTSPLHVPVLGGPHPSQPALKGEEIVSIDLGGLNRDELFTIWSDTSMGAASQRVSHYSIDHFRYPGTRESLTLATKVTPLGPPGALDPTQAEWSAAPGDLIHMLITSGPEFFDTPFVLLAELLPSSTVSPSVLGIHVNLTATFLVGEPIPTVPGGFPATLSSAGFPFALYVPLTANLGGHRLVLQSGVVTTSAANAFYATTAAHEICF